MSVLYLDVSEIAAKVVPRKKGLFFLHHHKPERHNLRLIVGGQSPKQYAPRTNQSNTTPQTAA